MRNRTVSELLRTGRLALPESATPDLDVELLLSKCLGMERSQLLTHTDEVVSSRQADTYNQAVSQRATGYPIAYLRGEQEFYGRAFIVTPDVLIPRPETELLVETVLEYTSIGDDVIDCGTGSGCIAVSVACTRSDVSVHAVDQSADALTVARQNAQRHSANVSFYYDDLLPNQRFDPSTTVIAANLPYVSDDDYHTLPNLRHEPAAALRGGADGLDLIRRLLAKLHQWPSMPKVIVLEIDPAQAPSVSRLGSRVEIKNDLSGQARIAVLKADAHQA